MSAPTSLPPQPTLGSAGEHCGHCGSELAPDQRYCLNCGLRRAAPRVQYRELLLGEAPPEPATAAAPPAVPPAPVAAPAAAADGESRAISPLGAAVAIGLLLLATLLGAVIGKGSGDQQQPVVVGGAPPAATAAAVTSDWKAGDAWTVQLQAFPKDSTTPQQVQQAKTAAQAKGAANVGVLVSDDFPSLTAGQYVLYSGDYAGKAEAQKALDGLRANFPDATVIQVSKTAAAAEAGAAAGAAKGKNSGGSSSSGSADPPAAVQNLQNSPSTKDYVTRSKKLPDKVGTGGAAPPKDNKAPGGGDGGGTTIG